jgi:hypothetical protein
MSWEAGPGHTPESLRRSWALPGEAELEGERLDEEPGEAGEEAALDEAAAWEAIEALDDPEEEQ